MPKYIDSEALKRDLIDNRNFYPAIVANAIEHAPACDVVEVVRCKDCKYLQNWQPMCYCAIWKTDHGLGKLGFCSYGERKED